MKTEEEVRQFKNRRGEYQSKIRRETGKGYLIYLRKGALTFYAFGPACVLAIARPSGPTILFIYQFYLFHD